MTNPTARTYADALAAAQAMHPAARPTVCDCADPRPVPASTPGRAVCARCSREWVTAEPASDRTAVPADQRPAVGDAFRVVLVGPSFGRVGRVVAPGMVDMVDGGSPSGLVAADMVRITPDAYVAARLAAADPRGGAQRAVEASRADERADTEPSPARGPLSPLSALPRPRATLRVPTTTLGILADAARLAEREADRRESLAAALGTPGTPFRLTDADTAMAALLGIDAATMRDRVLANRDAAHADAEAARFRATVADARYALTATVLDAEQTVTACRVSADMLDASPTSTADQRDAADAATLNAAAAYRLAASLLAALDGQTTAGPRIPFEGVQALIVDAFAAGYPGALLATVERAAVEA